MSFAEHPASDMRAQNGGSCVVSAEPFGIDESGIHAFGRQFAVCKEKIEMLRRDIISELIHNDFRQDIFRPHAKTGDNLITRS